MQTGWGQIPAGTCRKGLLLKLCVLVSPVTMFLVAQCIKAAEHSDDVRQTPELQKRAAAPATWAAYICAVCVRAAAAAQAAEYQGQRQTLTATTAEPRRASGGSVVVSCGYQPTEETHWP